MITRKARWLKSPNSAHRVAVAVLDDAFLSPIGEPLGPRAVRSALGGLSSQECFRQRGIRMFHHQPEDSEVMLSSLLAEGVG